MEKILENRAFIKSYKKRYNKKRIFEKDLPAFMEEYYNTRASSFRGKTLNLHEAKEIISMREDEDWNFMYIGKLLCKTFGIYDGTGFENTGRRFYEIAKHKLYDKAKNI